MKMKKIILSLAILASVFTVQAQETKTDGKCTSKTECTKSCDKKDCGKKDCKKKDCGKPECGKKDYFQSPAFKGITLTDDQKKKIEALNTAGKPAKAQRDGKVTKEEMKAKREEMKKQREKARSKYLEGMKSILTPEQYTKYLENCASIQKHGKKVKKGKTAHLSHKKANKKVKINSNAKVNKKVRKHNRTQGAAEAQA